MVAGPSIRKRMNALIRGIEQALKSNEVVELNELDEIDVHLIKDWFSRDGRKELYDVRSRVEINKNSGMPIIYYLHISKK